MLGQERQFYTEKKAEWLPIHAGKFVLIKGDELIGVFNTVDEALAEGARRFGLGPFLVRRVEVQETEAEVPALMLGILRADLPLSNQFSSIMA